jgi:hypothetical protein
VDQVGVSHGSRQPSIRLQVIPAVCYFQGWIPEDWIKWVMAFREIENLMPMKEPGQDQDILDFVEGSSLILN